MPVHSSGRVHEASKYPFDAIAVHLMKKDVGEYVRIYGVVNLGGDCAAKLYSTRP
jgi:hypothetical protein